MTFITYINEAAKKVTQPAFISQLKTRYKNKYGGKYSDLLKDIDKLTNAEKIDLLLFLTVMEK